MNINLTPIELHFGDITLTSPIQDGHRMIPVKTVCEIIDVRFQEQDSWLKEHPFYGQLYGLASTVGADGKQRKMNCLSIFDVAGWVSSISASNRREGSLNKQYAFLAWLREQTLALYKSIEAFQKENRYELELIEMKNEFVDQRLHHQDEAKRLGKQIKNVDKKIEEVRAKRYTGQTALPFPEEE